MKISNTWIRIINSCNSKCIFCLDSYSHNNKTIPSETIKNQIKNSFKPWFFNKIVISWWEASINPEFEKYIKYANQIWYNKIQTITNWQKFANLDFCKGIVEAWINEITFSIHWHTPELHDYLTWVPWSFKKALTWLLNIKKFFPEIIVNIDIVLNRVNIDFLPEIIKFFNKIWVYEFDLLQIIPFGKAEINIQNLYYNPISKIPIFQKIGELSLIPGMHIWTNRLNPQVLDWYEKLIQSPDKIRDEVTWEARWMFSLFITSKWKNKPGCFWEKCNYCFQRDYCNNFLNNIDKEKMEKKIDFEIILWEPSLEAIYNKYWEKKEDFINFLNNKKKKLINIPKCLWWSWIFDIYNDSQPKFTLEDYTNNFIYNLYRIKSLRCNDCKYNQNCEGIHINFIRSYWFDILKPKK